MKLYQTRSARDSSRRSPCRFPGKHAAKCKEISFQLKVIRHSSDQHVKRNRDASTCTSNTKLPAFEFSRARGNGGEGEGEGGNLRGMPLIGIRKAGKPTVAGGPQGLITLEEIFSIAKSVVGPGWAGRARHLQGV